MKKINDRFFLFIYRVCHAFLSVHCSLGVTCWKMASVLILLYVMFYGVLVTFPYGVLGQVWYLIESIPDLCLLTNFYNLGAWTPNHHRSQITDPPMTVLEKYRDHVYLSGSKKRK